MDDARPAAGVSGAEFAATASVAVLDAIAQVHEALYVVRNVQREVMIDGDRAAVISDRTVVQRATGRTMVYRVAAFLRFRGDKLVCVSVLLRQLRHAGAGDRAAAGCPRHLSARRVRER